MDDDLEPVECDKFDDCKNCKWRFQPELYCEDDCDYGEMFEEEDPDEVDKYFQGRV